MFLKHPQSDWRPSGRKAAWEPFFCSLGRASTCTMLESHEGPSKSIETPVRQHAAIFRLECLGCWAGISLPNLMSTNVQSEVHSELLPLLPLLPACFALAAGLSSAMLNDAQCQQQNQKPPTSCSCWLSCLVWGMQLHFGKVFI